MGNSVSEDHGERLRALEGSLGDIKTSTALHTQELGHVVEKIEAGFKNIGERLDAGQRQFEAHSTKLEAHSVSLGTLEKTEASRNKRWSAVKRLIMPLMAAGAGVMVTKGGEMIWTWLMAFLHLG